MFSATVLENANREHFNQCRQFYYTVQFSSVSQSCPTLCDPMNRSTRGLPVHHRLPEFMQTHVHRVSDAIQPSHPLSSPSPPAPNPSQYQTKLTKKDRRRKKKYTHNESQAQIKRENTKNKILQQTWSSIGSIGDPAEKRKIKKFVIKDIMAKKFQELIKELESPKNS